MKKLLLALSVMLVALFTASCSLNGLIDNINNNNINNSPIIFPASFELESSEGKDVLTGAEVYAKVAPSMVSIVNFGTNTQSEGSGIILSEDGLIITNAHVIENANTLKVYLNNEQNSEYTATNFWYDTYTDLGVIKINETGLTPAEFGDPDEMSIGEDIYAIGNPGGMEFKYSITKGIISYKYRPYSPISDSGYTINVLQVDAPINPGNSGGALVNLYGQVIGINSAKIVATGFEGLGFSISIKDALPIISSLIENGHVNGRPALGITYQLKLDYLGNIIGMQIISIRPESDLDDKGIRVGDLITQIGDVVINTDTAVKNSLVGKNAGDIVTIKFTRNLITYTADVELIDASLLNS